MSERNVWREAISPALKAPSLRNIQPWRLWLAADRLEVLLESPNGAGPQPERKPLEQVLVAEEPLTTNPDPGAHR